jgi:CRP-like cAMP-binding protein
MKRLIMGEAENRGLAHTAGQLEFFSTLKGADLDRILSHIELYAFNRGEAIFKKGDPADALYIVHQGEVVIQMSRWFALFRKVARLKPGNLFGEMGLLENRRRAFTATAKMDTQLFVLLKRDFDELLRRNPIFSEGIRWLAQRRQFEGTRLRSP